ncbi:MAG TPA: helix-turn-helix transcriptional regulator [Streptosporangiaceae bacterium]|nr:helix-turn-helix transcriptional regulator [Streptosporangiaceae bacterium]
MIDAPPVRRLLLGAALRRYRENLGLTLEDAARVLECDRSKISRIETGQRGIRPKELRELLTEYGVDEQEASALAAIVQARRRGSRRRKQHHHGDAVSGPCWEYLTLEQAASDIFTYDPQHVPDVLQTPQYARATVTSDPSLPTDSAQDMLTELNLSRQQILEEQRPRVTALIGETALREATGDPDVMRDQLRALAVASERIVVQVLPSGCRAPSSGPVTILRFAGIPNLGAVYLPGLSGGTCLAGQQDVASCTRAFEQLRASALNPAASARLIRDIAEG